MIDFLLAVAVVPLLLPAFSLLALTLAALPQRGKTRGPPATGGDSPVRVAVLVPAHNESTHVLPTIECLRGQLGPRDRVIVIADNCGAARDGGAGAEVIERSNTELRGKGYALAFGVDHLRADPPDVVLVVDADCVLSAGALACIAQDCRRSGNPVQMLDLMNAGAGAGLRLRVLEFAMLMKNLVRPLGSYSLGRACHLMGTGMAVPWTLMATAKLATGHVAEDMKLGVEMAIAGHAPRFLPDVRVSSAFPDDTGVAKVQKSRWEHGHLATLMEELPALLKVALTRRDPALWVLAMDLLIPPVAFYFLLLGGVLALSVIAAWLWPVFGVMAGMVGVAALCFALAIGLAWFFFGRHLLSARELLTTPLYALWKVPVYVAFFLKKRSGWVRTKRDSE
jgi:cellulose synthase/poly-beta-1,6-N-acetylglucosamine synthase-like glycosyltransferase